jgi:hypothetical protein
VSECSFLVSVFVVNNSCSVYINSSEQHHFSSYIRFTSYQDYHIRLQPFLHSPKSDINISASTPCLPTKSHQPSTSAPTSPSSTSRTPTSTHHALLTKSNPSYTHPNNHPTLRFPLKSGPSFHLHNLLAAAARSIQTQASWYIGPHCVPGLLARCSGSEYLLGVW